MTARRIKLIIFSIIFLKKYSQIKYISIQDEIPGLVRKKRALTEGVNHAQGEVLLFTDADCRPGKFWLSSMNDVFSRGFDVVVGYSPLECQGKGFGKKIICMLKKLERLAMFTLSDGSIGWNWGITATGRNFAYKKNVFESIGGYEGIGHIPSGDDDLFFRRSAKAIRTNSDLQLIRTAMCLLSSKSPVRRHFSRKSGVVPSGGTILHS